MRYLCFDIECCDGEHICEFGYVITDDKFNVLEKDIILINPEEKFNLTGRKNQSDLTLFYSEEEYYASPIFPIFYERIKTLITDRGQIVIGHAIINDAKFLNIACKRYHLPSIDFNFFDSQKAFEQYSRFNSISLEKVGDELGVSKPLYMHRSMDDALLTLDVVKSMCDNLQISLNDFRELCPEACGYNKRYFGMYNGNSLIDRLNKLAVNENFVSNNKKDKTIQELSAKVCPKGEIIESILNNKKICFSIDFEKHHLKETLILIQHLANYGCAYNRKVAENDYYVATEEELNSMEKDIHSRYYAATEITDDGRDVTVISVDELLKILNLTKQEIQNMEFPKATYFKLRTKKKKNKKVTNNHATTCIGNLFNYNKNMKCEVHPKS